MSVRVNLLPSEVEQRQKAAKGRAAMAAAGLGFVAALGGVYVWQLGQVSDAQAELEAEEEELRALTAEVEELREFSELRDRRSAAMERLTVSLAGEASFAGILQDVATVMPPETALENLQINLVATEQALGDDRPPVGSLAMSGRTLRGHAPGLERLLLEFDKLGAVGDLFFSNSEVDEETGDVMFSVEADLGPEIFTGRYWAGLPEGLR